MWSCSEPMTARAAAAVFPSAAWIARSTPASPASRGLQP